jgi:hypothetical protein
MTSFFAPAGARFAFHMKNTLSFHFHSAVMPNPRVKTDARVAGFTSWLHLRAGAPYPER